MIATGLPKLLGTSLGSGGNEPAVVALLNNKFAPGI